MMTPIPLAVVGAGRIGRMHIENIQREVSDFRIEALIDPHVDADWAAGRGLRCFHGLSEAREAVRVQAIAIFAPSPLHVALIRESAPFGLPIFCEKPVAFDSATLQSLRREVQSQGSDVMVGLNRRFDPHLRRVRNKVAAGSVGPLHLLRITNRDPKRPDLAFAAQSGGLFLDFSVHDFDMARFVSGAEVEKIYVAGATLIQPELRALNDIDTALITMHLSNGALCVIDNSREAVYGYDQRLEAFGPKGTQQAENVRPHTVSLRTAAGHQTANPEPTFVERYHHAYLEEMRAFAHYCRAPQHGPPVTLDDMAKAVDIAAAAKRSLESGQAVRL